MTEEHPEFQNTARRAQQALVDFMVRTARMQSKHHGVPEVVAQHAVLEGVLCEIVRAFVFCTVDGADPQLVNADLVEHVLDYATQAWAEKTPGAAGNVVQFPTKLNS